MNQKQWGSLPTSQGPLCVREAVPKRYAEMRTKWAPGGRMRHASQSAVVRTGQPSMDTTLSPGARCGASGLLSLSFLSARSTGQADKTLVHVPEMFTCINEGILPCNHHAWLHVGSERARDVHTSAGILSARVWREARLITAPRPVAYRGSSSQGRQKASSQQAQHSTALCHTPAHTTCAAPLHGMKR